MPRWPPARRGPRADRAPAHQLVEAVPDIAGPQVRSGDRARRLGVLDGEQVLDDDIVLGVDPAVAPDLFEVDSQPPEKCAAAEKSSAGRTALPVAISDSSPGP